MGNFLGVNARRGRFFARRSFIALFILLFSAMSAPSSFAQFGIGGGGGTPFPDVGDLQSQYNSYNLDILGDNLVGDHTDMDTGALSLTQTDVSIPDTIDAVKNTIENIKERLD